MTQTYCHCYNVFRCEPATAEAQDQNGLWIPLCERCMQIAFDAGIRVRKLQPRSGPRLTPTELARDLGMERRDVVQLCIDRGVPILNGRIDKTRWLAASGTR